MITKQATAKGDEDKEVNSIGKKPFVKPLMTTQSAQSVGAAAAVTRLWFGAVPLDSAPQCADSLGLINPRAGTRSMIDGNFSIYARELEEGGNKNEQERTKGAHHSPIRRSVSPFT